MSYRDSRPRERDYDREPPRHSAPRDYGDRRSYSGDRDRDRDRDSDRDRRDYGSSSRDRGPYDRGTIGLL